MQALLCGAGLDQAVDEAALIELAENQVAQRLFLNSETALSENSLMPSRLRRDLVEQKFAGRVVAVPVDELAGGAFLNLDASSSQERHFLLRQREFLRLGVGGTE